MSVVRISVVGLGYVGLPLAVALARHFPTVGFDIKPGRIAELRQGHDRTGELAREALAASKLELTSDLGALRGNDLYIITVPTPVDAQNQPDLTAVRKACSSVGSVMGKGAIVVIESTVYPGVTEDVCGPELAAASGLTCGRDFFLGYSPERINPGDRQHTVDRITKVVAGQTPEVARKLVEVYGAITSGGTHVAPSIKVAEAAKVIENAQRDINIAFINEVTTIFGRLGISIYDVLEAAGTKWNFLRFTPGLVGGHCIGVDPFYLADLARRLGHNPEIILAGRRMNDHMGRYIAERVHALLSEGGKPAGARILVLGLTFKENVPDIRNSKVVDVIGRLRELRHDVAVHDPLAAKDEAREEYGLDLLAEPLAAAPWDCVIGAVPHDCFRDADVAWFTKLMGGGGVLADVKGMWRSRTLPSNIRRWEL